MLVVFTYGKRHFVIIWNVEVSLFFISFYFNPFEFISFISKLGYQGVSYLLYNLDRLRLVCILRTFSRPFEIDPYFLFLIWRWSFALRVTFFSRIRGNERLIFKKVFSLWTLRRRFNFIFKLGHFFPSPFFLLPFFLILVSHSFRIKFCHALLI